MAVEKRQFLFGMDFDSDERFIEPGFSRKNLNVHIGSSESDGLGTAENLEGNTLIPNTELPLGENKVIGSYWYKRDDLNYIFIWNENGNHGIYEYNHVSSKIETVLIDSVLNFQKDSLITGINVIEFDDNNFFLFWVDKANPPRKININKCKNGDYATINEAVIDAIKYPPLCAPTALYEQDDTINTNYLNDSIWQFKAAYVYDDKEISAWSPISVQVLPNTSCSSTAQGNTIRIVIPKGGELVERVQLAGRDSNINDFIEVIDQDVSDYEVDANGDYVYLFRNDKVYSTIDIRQSVKLFDNVPQIAGAQEYINNRVTYADITEGYDNVDVDYSLDLDFEDVQERPLGTISGAIRIQQIQGGAGSGASGSGVVTNFQPIHNFNGTNYFGAFGENTFGVVFDEDVTGYAQTLPLGGFVVYLAGTDYYSVSKQSTIVNAASSGDNIYVSDRRSNRSDILRAIKGNGSNFYTRRGFTTQVLSNFTIEDVPDGKYLLRVASHKTTTEDLESGTRAYQETSTYVQNIQRYPIGGSTNTSAYGNFSGDSNFGQNVVYELEVEIVNGSIIDDVEVVIADLSSPGISIDSAAVAGYLVDSPEDDYDPSDLTELLGQRRIEQAKVEFDLRNSSQVLTTYTDHNGFFYGSSRNDIRLEDLISGLIGSNRSQFYRLENAVPPVSNEFSNFDTGENTEVVLLNKDSRITRFSNANISFRFTDANGQGASNIVVVSNRGDVQISDSIGVAVLNLDARAGQTLRSSDFYFYVKGGCLASFSPSQILLDDLRIGENFNNSTLDDVDGGVVTVSFSDISNKSFLKLGGAYEYGIVYYDRGNRSGATNFIEEGSLIVPFYTEGYTDADQTFDTVSRPPIVNWEIKSLAPNWATHYQWVRTRNTATDRYIQWYSNEIEYQDLNGDPSNFTDGDRISIDITNLSDQYKKANPDSVLSYDFSQGDRLRLIRDSNRNFFDSYFDLKVLGFSEGKILIESLGGLPDLSDGFLFEVYTPKLDIEERFFYEVGECFEVDKALNAQGDTISIHKGRTQDQDPLNPSAIPAKGIFQTGDTYYRTRKVPVTDGNVSFPIDSQYFSDFWESKISDIGRANAIRKDAKQVNRPTTVYYSERFIPETNINGLNSFFDDSFETYDREYGAIKKLFSIDKRLDCYQETKVSKILVEENVIFDQFDNGTIGSSEKVLSKPIYYKGEYGTLNPESFAENEGRRYFFDVRNGKVLRLSNDGLTPISDKKMHSYFESKSNFYSAFNQVPEVWGVFDENYNEYIINFGSISRDSGFTPDDLALVSSQAETVTEVRNGLTYTFVLGYSENTDGVPTEFEIVRDLQNGTYVIVSRSGSIQLARQELLSIPSETLGFSERTGHWTSFYDYLPECMSRVGIDFLTFKNGRTYLHNSNPLRNNFYGVRYPSEVWAVFNQQPSDNKIFQAIAEESDTIWIVREMLTENGQKSNLIEQDFQEDNGQGLVYDATENVHYAPVLRDENTPNVDIPLIEGDNMRDVTILVKFQKDTDNLERLFAVNMNYTLSYRLIR